MGKRSGGAKSEPKQKDEKVDGERREEKKSSQKKEG